MNYKFILFLITLFVFSSCRLLTSDDEDFDFLPIPELHTPNNNSFFFFNQTSVNFSADLVWGGSPYTYTYTILVSKDSNFLTDVEEFETQVLDYYRFDCGTITDTTQYYWKVKANASDYADFGGSEFSEVFTFTIGIPHEIICFKCGVYNCLADVHLVTDLIDSVYTNVPLTISVIPTPDTNEFIIIYTTQVDNYTLTSSVNAFDHDNVYSSMEQGTFYIGNYTTNVNNVGLTIVNSNWQFLDNPEMAGVLTFTGLNTNFTATYNFTGSY